MAVSGGGGGGGGRAQPRGQQVGGPASSQSIIIATWVPAADALSLSSPYSNASRPALG